jgi:hypothetical protein
MGETFEQFIALRRLHRRAMRRWWMRVGNWWILAAALLLLTEIYFAWFVDPAAAGHGLLPAPLIMNEAWFFAVTVNTVYEPLAGLLWLLAAARLLGLVTDHAERQAVPPISPPVRYLLALQQGLLPLLIVTVIGQVTAYNNQGNQAAGWVPNWVNLTWFMGTGHVPFTFLLSMVFVLALLALPRGRSLAWAALSTFVLLPFVLTVVTTAPNYFWNVNMRGYAYQNVRLFPGWVAWAVGLLLPLGALLAARANHFFPAWLLLAGMTVRELVVRLAGMLGGDQAFSIEAPSWYALAHRISLGWQGVPFFFYPGRMYMDSMRSGQVITDFIALRFSLFGLGWEGEVAGWWAVLAWIGNLIWALTVLAMFGLVLHFSPRRQSLLSSANARAADPALR